MPPRPEEPNVSEIGRKPLDLGRAIAVIVDPDADPRIAGCLGQLDSASDRPREQKDEFRFRDRPHLLAQPPGTGPLRQGTHVERPSSEELNDATISPGRLEVAEWRPVNVCPATGRPPIQRVREPALQPEHNVVMPGQDDEPSLRWEVVNFIPVASWQRTPQQLPPQASESLRSRPRTPGNTPGQIPAVRPARRGPGLG
jgi:hypothetical protein